MKTLRNCLLVLTLVVATLSFVGCGNRDKTNNNATTTMRETSTHESTTHSGNSGMINETTDNGGVIDNIEDTIESGVHDVESGVNDIIDNNATTRNNNNNTK